MANEDDQAIVSAKMDALRDKILWSPEALDTFLSLIKGEELSWASRLPDTDDENVRKHIWTAYFTVSDYMKNAVYDVSNAYIRDLILKMAIQIAEDAEEGSVSYAVASYSQSSSSLSVSLAPAGKSGAMISQVESLLKSLDTFRVKTMSYEDRGYLR